MMTTSPRICRARLWPAGLIVIASLASTTAALAECEPSKESCDLPGRVGQNAVDQMKALRDSMPAEMRSMLDKAIDDAQEAVNKNSDPADGLEENSASGSGTGANSGGGDDGSSSNSDN